MKAFRRAVEASDLPALKALLSPEVIFHSPASFKPFRGAELVGFVLETVSTVFEDFGYTAEFQDGPRSGLVFRARIGDKQVEGIDLIETDEKGLISSLTVMVRPLSGVLALAEAMGARLGKDPR